MNGNPSGARASPPVFVFARNQTDGLSIPQIHSRNLMNENRTVRSLRYFFRPHEPRLESRDSSSARAYNMLAAPVKQIGRKAARASEANFNTLQHAYLRRSRGLASSAEISCSQRMLTIREAAPECIDVARVLLDIDPAMAVQ